MREWMKGLFLTHLSTAVVLMFAAGFLIWANTQGCERVNEGRRIICCTLGLTVTPIELDKLSHFRINENKYGWPLTAFTSVRTNGDMLESDWSDFQIAEAAVNVMVALGILFLVWFVCECWIRWPERDEVFAAP